MNCLRFIVSICLTLAKCSGANVGIPSNINFLLDEHIVSPIENMPGSNTPIISPAYASSTICLSCAIICCGCESLIFFPPCTWLASIPAVNFPEHIRINAILSLCALFILACILNTNAEKSSLNGSIGPAEELRGSGDVVISRKCCKNVSTPKLVRAEPKNTGVRSPACTFARSNSALAPSRSSTSSSNLER